MSRTLIAAACAAMVAAAAGYWLAARQYGRPLDVSAAATPAKSEPAEPPKPPAKPEPAKAAPKPARPPAAAPATAPPPRAVAAKPKAPPTFDEAWGEAAGVAAAWEAEGRAVLKEKMRLFDRDEAWLVELQLRSKRVAGSMRPDAHALLVAAGAEKLSLGLRVQYALSDAAFRRVAERVWGRSPKSRGVEFLCGLAGRWGMLDSSSRGGVLEIVDDVEDGKRELLREEREILLAFAGEEYYLNRPRP